jgi:hypothetical protein
MSGNLKVAQFTVQATMEQSIRWKQAAEMAGRAVGAWIAEAADAYRERVQAKLPTAPLSWRRGARFRVVLMDGEEVEGNGMLSPPFAVFYGHAEGTAGATGPKCYSLVFLPERRILASFRYADQCKALAAELAPTLLHGLPRPDPGGGLPGSFVEAPSSP